MAGTGAQDGGTTMGTELRSAEDGEALFVELVGRHADELLAIARRNTICHDDAFDAYQRTLELALRHARRLERETAHRWLFRVCRNEALALRRQRDTDVGLLDVDFDGFVDDAGRSPEEHALVGETVDRSAEALKRLKPDELRALWLRASGLTYAEIAGVTGWTRTKVNRCLSEGRRRFLARYAEIETGAECERWSLVRSAMVDGEAGRRELAAFRPHLRNCPACRATVRELQQTRPGLGVLLPVGVLGTATPAVPSRSETLAGWLTRGWEAVAGPVGERSTIAALKLQTAFDAASGAKLAALAASATVAAGGGAAVVARDAPRERPGVSRAFEAVALPGRRVAEVPPGVPGAPRQDAPAPGRPVEARGRPLATGEFDRDRVRAPEFGPRPQRLPLRAGTGAPSTVAVAELAPGPAARRRPFRPTTARTRPRAAPAPAEFGP